MNNWIFNVKKELHVNGTLRIGACASDDKCNFCDLDTQDI